MTFITPLANLNLHTFVLSLKIASHIPIEPKVRDFAKEKGLIEKPDKHITILGNERSETVIKMIQARANKVLVGTQVERIVFGVNWDATLLSELYLLEKVYLDKDKKPETRKSIVQRVSISGAGIFFDRLNKHFDHNFGRPWLHITLFTHSTNPANKHRGIDVDNHQDITDLLKWKL